MPMSTRKHRYYETCKLYFVLCFGINNSLLSSQDTYPETNFLTNLDILGTMDVLVHRFNETHPLSYNETINTVLRKNEHYLKYRLGESIAEKIMDAYDDQKIKNCIDHVLECLLTQENQLKFEKTAYKKEVEDEYLDLHYPQPYEDYPNLKSAKIDDIFPAEY